MPHDQGEWRKPFAVFSISRLYLHDDLGFPRDQVQDLTDTDMERLADYVAQFYEDVSPLADHVRFITTLILSQLQPTDEDIQRCDVCDTWVATHEVLVGQTLYSICDKAKCQDAVAAVKGQPDAQ